MTRYWRDAEDDESATTHTCCELNGERACLVGPVEGLLVRGSREQAMTRMLQEEWRRTPQYAETQAEWIRTEKPHMGRLLAAALGEQENR